MENLQKTEAVATETVVPAQKPVQKNQSHLPSIDGLRGLAAMMIVFFHCWGTNDLPPYPQFALLGITVPVYWIFVPCYSSVELFFVLSGFCLAYPFLANPQRKDNWPGYALSRVRRIFPPYLISFLILFLIGQWIGREQGSKQNFLYESFKTHRLIPELLLIKRSHMVGSYWTLLLECRWYFCFPVLLMLARRVSPAILIAALYAIAYFAQKPVFAGPLDAATLMLLVTFMPLFGWGIWAARLAALKPETLHVWERWIAEHSLLGVGASVLWCLAWRPEVRTISPLGLATVWGPFYFFLILAALKQPWFKRVFSSAPLVKLGVISYSLYLLQEPIIRGGHLLVQKLGQEGPLFLASQYLALPALCVLGGWAFYYIGERPFLKRARK